MATHTASSSPFLLAREAAQIARVTPATLRGWIEVGVLPAARLPGGYRVARADLDALLTRRAVTTPPPDWRALAGSRYAGPTA